MLSVWVLVFCLAAAARGQLQGQGHVYEQLFHDLDDDGNRFISRAEFNNAVPSLDLDGDGQVTEQEFIRAFQSATSASDANRHAAELLFAAIDSNQDGSVPVNQMDPLFRVFDTDRDGEISNLEFLQEWYNRPTKPNFGQRSKTVTFEQQATLEQHGTVCLTHNEVWRPDMASYQTTYKIHPDHGTHQNHH